MLFDEGDTLRIGAVQAEIVEQNREVVQPLLPGFLGDILVNALTEFARVGRKIEAGGLALEFQAKDNA